MCSQTFYVVRGGEPPDPWRHACVKVIFKKGDPTLPENYRPILILPIMYKLFAMALNGRPAKFPDGNQS
eukprot:8764923-Pyramimonas_sp.AAC.1